MASIQDCRNAFVVAAGIALAACSNGRGSLSESTSPPASGSPPASPPPDPPALNPPPAPPPAPPPDPGQTKPVAAMAGYWQGVAQREADDHLFEIVALIDRSGDAHWIVTPSGQDLEKDDDKDETHFVAFGNLCCGSRFEAQLSAQERLRTRRRQARLEVERDGDSLHGHLEFRDRHYPFTLMHSPEYERGLTMQELAGVYVGDSLSAQGTGSTLTLTIAADGQLTAADANGCIFNGTAEIADVRFNMVRLQLEMANCGSTSASSPDWNGPYDGLGLLLQEHLLYYNVIGPVWLGARSLER